MLACLREVSKDCYEKGDEENLTFGVIMFGGLLKAEDSERVLMPKSICAQTCSFEKMRLSILKACSIMVLVGPQYYEVL